MSEIKFAYRPPRELAQDVWEIHGDWTNKFGRRMTVVRLRDRSLMIHNAFKLHDQDLEWLKSIGTPKFIVAPNSFHCSDAGWMARKFPDAQLFVPASKLETFRKDGFAPKDVNSQFPSTNELKCIATQGTRIEEAAFVHVPSKTLILCDLAFNMADVFSGFAKFFMSWNKVGGQFGPSRLTKLVFAKNKSKLLESYRAILNEDFDRVIVNHGDILDSGGREKLRSGIERIFGPL